jgi:hypothetical protein
MIRCFVDKYSLLCASDESSIKYAIEKKMKEINKEDEVLEETIIKGIISSCENMLDDLECHAGEKEAYIKDRDMQDIIYADNVLLDIQQRLSKQLVPSNITQSQDDAVQSLIDKNIAPMTNRIYSDDEHGNVL